jgi:hypothetical protein
MSTLQSMAFTSLIAARVDAEFSFVI